MFDDDCDNNERETRKKTNIEMKYKTSSFFIYSLI